MGDIEDSEIKGLEHRDRKEVLKALDQGVDEALKKVKSGRIYNNTNERTRIKWLKALGYLADVFRKVKKDDDLEELQSRIEELEGEKNE